MSEVANNGLPPTMNRLAKLSLPARCGMLAAVMLPALLLGCVIGFVLAGPVGLGAAALSGGVCWFSATAALLFTGVTTTPGNYTIGGILGGNALRFGVPLAIGYLIHQQGGPLAEAGILYYLLAFYLVAMAAETPLSLAPEEEIPSPEAQKAGSATHG